MRRLKQLGQVEEVGVVRRSQRAGVAGGDLRANASLIRQCRKQLHVTGIRIIRLIAMHVDELVVFRSQLNYRVHGMLAKLTALFEMGDAAHAVGTHLESFLHQLGPRFAMRALVGVHALLREADDLESDRILQFLLKLQQRL